jgi:hypothetical protein
MWPKASRGGIAIAAIFGALAIGGALEGRWVVTVVLAAIAVLIALSIIHHSATASGMLLRALEKHFDDPVVIETPSLNGSAPASHLTRIKPAPPISNGTGPHPEHDATPAPAPLEELQSPAHGIVMPSSMSMHERGLNIIERED